MVETIGTMDDGCVVVKSEERNDNQQQLVKNIYIDARILCALKLRSDNELYRGTYGLRVTS